MLLEGLKDGQGAGGLTKMVLGRGRLKLARRGYHPSRGSSQPPKWHIKVRGRELRAATETVPVSCG